MKLAKDRLVICKPVTSIPKFNARKTKTSWNYGKEAYGHRWVEGQSLGSNAKQGSVDKENAVCALAAQTYQESKIYYHTYHN